MTGLFGLVINWLLKFHNKETGLLLFWFFFPFSLYIKLTGLFFLIGSGFAL